MMSYYTLSEVRNKTKAEIDRLSKDDFIHFLTITIDRFCEDKKLRQVEKTQIALEVYRNLEEQRREMV